MRSVTAISDHSQQRRIDADSVVFYLLSYVVERGGNSGGDFVVGDDWMTVSNFSLESLKDWRESVQQASMRVALRKYLGKPAEVDELMQVYQPGMTAGEWVDRLNAVRPTDKQLTPEQVEMLIEILKIVLQILILLG